MNVLPVKILTDDPRPVTTVLMAMAFTTKWTDLPDRRRRELHSALQTVAKLAGLPDNPELVLLVPDLLRRKVLNRPAIAIGIAAKRWRNVLSALRYVLRRLDIIDQAYCAFSTSWTERLDTLSAHDKCGLMQFGRFCSRRQVAPSDVTEIDLEAFRDWLTDRTICLKPTKDAGTARKTWNRMVKKTPGWPNRSLAILNQNGQYALPLQDFPESFQADLADFGARLQATPLDDPLDDDDLDDAAFEAKLSKRSLPPKALKATSAANRMDHARWAASGLVATGTPISEITSLDCLVSPLLNAKQILRYFKARAGGKPSAAGTHVGGVLVMIAKYHAMLPMEDAKKISSWSKGLKLKYESMTEKNRTAMDAVMHPARERLLLALPIALMKAADRLLPIAPDQSASLAFRGVAIAFLSSAPVRLSNAIGLRVDRNLQRDDPKTAHHFGDHDPRVGKQNRHTYSYVGITRPERAPARMDYQIPSASCVYRLPLFVSRRW